jgi:two-component system CitB family response regulator
MAGGVLHYLVKPFTAATLRERLGDYLRHYEEVRRSASAATLDQEAVDRLLAQPRTSGPLPKGLSRRTLDLIAAALDGIDGDASASEVAGMVGVSRVSARRYLEHLVARGQADVVPRYGGTGRPENRYRSNRRPTYSRD